MHLLSGQLAQALATTKLALQVFRDLEDTVSEAEARNNIGDFYLAAGDQAAARDSYLLALALIGDDAVPLERARAADGIARTGRR